MEFELEVQISVLVSFVVYLSHEFQNLGLKFFVKKHT